MFVMIRTLFALVLLVFFNTINSVESRHLKILINSPTFAYSHVKFQALLALKLANEGHHVTILAVRVNALLTVNLIEKDLIRHKYIKVINIDRPTNINPMMSLKMANEPFNGHQNMFLDGNFAILAKTAFDVCNETTSNRTLMNWLRRADFDVGISEEIDMCAFAIFHYAGIRTKIVSDSLALYLSVANILGIPLPPSIVPNLGAASNDAPYMSFVNRARALFYDTIETVYFANSAAEMDRLIFTKNFGIGFPPLMEIMKNTSLILVNQCEALDLPHPISAKVVNIGGIALDKRDRLNKKLRKVFRTPHLGIVLVSFGKLAEKKKRGADVQLAMIRTFSRFVNHSFIWKLRPATSEVKRALQNATNIFIFDWINQYNLLRQSGIKAFVTHCGLQNYQDAAWAGVPMVGIPLFADHLYNCAAMKHHGLGVIVDVRDLTKSNDASLFNALTEVLNDSRYSKNAHEMSQKLQTQPFNPVEKLTKYVKYAAEFNDFNELNLPYHDEVGLLQYYSVDVVLAAVGLISVLAVVTVIIPIHCFLSVLCFRSKKY